MLPESHACFLFAVGRYRPTRKLRQPRNGGRTRGREPGPRRHRDPRHAGVAGLLPPARARRPGRGRRRAPRRGEDRGRPARRLGHRGACRPDPPRLRPPAGGHRMALAFLLPTPAAVDEKYAELAALGHGRKEPWDASWGQRYAVAADPDGNPVDLFAPL
ncbi:MAG TPA: VOC family protein [Rubrobacter sp.]|nr:VOC family protein [Rubrobacter sp.]